MKISIKLLKENLLKERITVISKMDPGFVLDNVLNPTNPAAITNKKLIFYDLETMGFGQAAYVHQIAALEYDLKTIAQKIFENPEQEISYSSTPSTAFISKAAFSNENFKEKDAETLNKRKTFLDNYLSKDGYYYKSSKNTKTLLKNYLLTDDGEVNSNLSEFQVEVIKGAHMARSVSHREKLGQLISKHLDNLKIDGVEVTTMISTMVDSLYDKQTVSYVNKSKEVVEQVQFIPKNLPRSLKEIEAYYQRFFKLVSVITEEPYTYPSSRPNKKYQNFNSLRRVRDKLATEFTFTWSENRAFTKYSEFPRPDYVKYMLNARGPGKSGETTKVIVGGTPRTVNLPTEEYGIDQFLRFIKKYDKEEYVLVGHNIKSFDNNIVLSKALQFNLPDELIKHFQDSYVFDTLTFLTMYVNQLIYFKQMSDKFDNLLDEKPMYKSLLSSTVAKHEKLKEKYSSLKAKLDGLMTLHEKTQSNIQQYTADDDCVQLFEVLIPSIVETIRMLSLYNAIKESVDTFTDMQIAEIPKDVPYDTVSMSTSEVGTAVLSKIKSDLFTLQYLSKNDQKEMLSDTPIDFLQLNAEDLEIPENDEVMTWKEKRKFKAMQENIAAAKNSIVKYYGQWLASKLLENKKYKDKTNLEIANIISLMKRSFIRDYFKKWLQSDHFKTQKTLVRNIEHIRRSLQDPVFSRFTSKEYERYMAASEKDPKLSPETYADELDMEKKKERARKKQAAEKAEQEELKEIKRIRMRFTK
jgi:hypothetical protein